MIIFVKFCILSILKTMAYRFIGSSKIYWHTLCFILNSKS